MPLRGKKEGTGQESLNERKVKQKTVADRVKKSKGGFSILLDWDRNARRGGGGLQSSVWGAEIYVAIKLGYSLLYGALPVPQPPRLPCTHLTTLTFMLTQKHSAASSSSPPLPLFPFQVLPSSSLSSPITPCLTTAGTQGACRVRLSTLLTSTAPHASLSPSFHLFPSV